MVGERMRGSGQSHMGFRTARQAILSRASAAPWGRSSMQRLLIKMQNVRAFGAVAVAAAAAVAVHLVVYSGTKNRIVFGLAETAL